MKMYRVSLFVPPEITEYEVVKVTKKSVWYRYKAYYSEEITTKRELKSGLYYKWFDTHPEAVNYVVARLTVKIDNAKAMLKLAEKTLREFES